jgi:hypothetical protein
MDARIGQYRQATLQVARDLRHDQSAGVDADERQLQGQVPLPAKR